MEAMRKRMKKNKKLPLSALPARLDTRLSVYARWFVLAIFAIHPLVIGPLGYQNITLFKYTSFLLILGAALFLMVCACFYTLMLGHTPKLRLKERFRSLRPFEVALLGYWVVLLLSAGTSDNLQAAFMGATLRNEGFWYQTAYILAFFIASRYYRPRTGDLLVLCAAASVVCLYAIPQYYGHDLLQFIHPGLQPQPHVGQVVYLGTMSNVNVASTYFCIALCVSAVLFAQHQGRMKWAFLACGWIIFYVVLLGDTESGYVGLLLALALCFPFAAKNRKSAARLLFFLAGCALLAWVFGAAWRAYYYEGEPPMASLLPWMPLVAGILAAVAAILRLAPIPELSRKVWRIGWIALVAVVAIAALVALPSLAEVTGNHTLAQASSILRGEVDDSFGSGRIGAWKEALSLVPEHPILGHGPDNFGSVYMERFLKVDPETGDLLDQPFDKAHNEYLQTLVDTGILGLLGILSFFVLLLWAARKKLDDPKVVAIAIALVAFLGQAFFNFSTPFAHPIAWTCWGILGALLREDAPAIDPANARPSRRERKNAVIRKSSG